MAAPVVNTDLGKLRGTTESNITGGKFVAFKGIPFARPPVGDLRFRDPEPAEPWTGVRDATNFGNMCPQYHEYQNKLVGSEDCLYLNVYVPSLKSSKSRAVIFFLHGGAFTGGSGNDDLHSPDYLMNKDVVLVTANYRTGCLGFLNLEDKAAAGNQGLKDQLMALEWVQRNISNFTGDPKNVTIFGNSAGSCSAHCLALSPLARGLFQKAILQSGVAINPFMEPEDSSRVYGARLGAILGCEVSDPTGLVDFLRTVDINELITAQNSITTLQFDARMILPFRPGSDSCSDNPVFPVSIEESVKLGIQVPCIIGHTRDECNFLADKLVALVGNRDGEDCLHPAAERRLQREGLSVKNTVKDCIGADEFSLQSIPKFMDLFTCVQFVSPAQDVLDIQMKVSKFPTFYYEFCFDSGKTLMKVFTKDPLPGACHVDDLSFLFHLKVLDNSGQEPLFRDPTHNRIIQQFTEMFTNFAKTGDPTPQRTKLIPIIWKPIDSATPKEYQCLKISDSLVLSAEKNRLTKLTEAV